MSLQVDKKTGEIVFSIHSKFERKTKGLEPGSMIIQHKDFAWDDSIRTFKVVDGEKEDRQAFIDSFESECGVYNILKKYSLTGDASLLNQRQGFYGDISDLPVDELNVNVVKQQADKSLDALNAVLGTEYSAEELQSMSSEELQSIIQKVVDAKTENKVEEVKKDGE